jgi:non-homologous end joining protein Ku
MMAMTQYTPAAVLREAVSITLSGLNINERVRAGALRRIASGSYTWHDVVDALPRKQQLALLKAVLRTRKRHLPVTISDQGVLVRRAQLRDYLRQVDLPFFLRSRPLPQAKGDTVRFRRPVPFGL